MPFEFDWFSHNIPRFERHLGHLAGKACRLLEVGCHEGQATCWMLKNVATHPGATIDCVDLVANDNFWPNIAEAGGLQKVAMYRGYSFEMMFRLPLGIYDFVYIDASHWTQSVLEDGILGFRLLKPEGIMAFDDYLWDDERFNKYGCPKPAVDFFLVAYAHLIDVQEEGAQVWLSKRIYPHPPPAR